MIDQANYNQAQGQQFWQNLLGSAGGSGAALGTMFSSYREYANYVNPISDSDGWYDYVGNPAPKNKLCQFKQHGDGDPWVGYASEFRPEMNVAYLKWKLTGIAKEAQDG